ncbi:MAG: hypothetical protein KGP14_02400 [Betaproteobacteria bacterium]|nr:hypothetical protein [Betaproteobacteria bacterium]
MLGFQSISVYPISAFTPEVGITIPDSSRLHHLTFKGIEYPKTMAADGPATLGRALTIVGGMEPKTIIGRQGPRSL